MEKEYLIKKWLDNDLSPSEEEAFKSLEDYASLTRLSNYAKQFSAPDLSYEEALEGVDEKIANKAKSTTTDWYKPLLKIAAVLAICFSVYYYTSNLDTNFTTTIAEKTIIALPDDSSVNLNALSQISFNKNSWDDQREVSLDGEAFFKVAKGSTFNVVTSSGVVSVLGTQFNVKHRRNHFEVTCYEGSVQVVYNNTKTILDPRQSFSVWNNTPKTDLAITVAKPEWLGDISAFNSVPLKEVLAEFERQYKVKIIPNNVNTDQLFTGKFTHTDIEIAIKSIVEPLQVTYTKTKQTIRLKRE